MNAHVIEPLLAAVRARITDPERQAIAAQIAADAAQLGVRQLAGEDVGAEIAHVEAQARLLAATEQQVVRDAVLGWATQAVEAVLRGVLVAAAAG